MKSWGQFQNKHGVKLNEVFSLFKKQMVRGGGQDYEHIAVVSPKSAQNLIKICNLQRKFISLMITYKKYAYA